MRLVGDGLEYLEVSNALGHGERPIFSAARIQQIESAPAIQVAVAGSAEAGTLPNLAETAYRDRSGTLHPPHFWLYSALATPLIAVVTALRGGPLLGFTLLNLCLLLLAFVVVSKRIGAPLSWMLFAGPIIWWVDKAHTEVFTFSMVAIAMALIWSRPWWSLACLGAAASQNLAIAPVLPVVLLGVVAGDRTRVRDWRLWAGVGAALALVSAHIIYFEVTVGSIDPQSLVGGARLRLPDWHEATAVLLDPNIGLLPNFPVLGPVLLGAIIVTLRHRRPARVHLEIGLAAVIAVVFMLGAAQTTNINSSATPGVSRYAIWFIPLSLALLAMLREVHAPWRHLLWVPVAVSMTASLAVYRPSIPVEYLRPSPLASWLWEHHPGLDNPPPEIFMERLSGIDGFALSGKAIATAGCAKALLIAGRWPATCPAPHPEMPAACRASHAGCYANRTDHGYEFVRTMQPA